MGLLDEEEPAEAEIIETGELLPASIESADEDQLSCPQCAKLFAGSGIIARNARAIHIKRAHKPTTAKKRGGPGRPKNRESGAETIQFVIDNFSQPILGRSVPGVARVLEWESPLLARELDEMVARTWFDDLVVQKIAGKEKRATSIASLVAFPIMCGIIERSEDPWKTYETLEKPLRRCLSEILPQKLGQIKEEREAEQEMLDQLEELGQLDPEYLKTDDPMGTFLFTEILGMRVAEGEPET